MIDIDTFYQGLGCEQSLGPDEQLRLFEQVRVACTFNSVTAIFESRPADEHNMAALFNVSGSYEGCLPFMTRSGSVALRINSEIEQDQTATVLECLDAALLALDISDAG